MKTIPEQIADLENTRAAKAARMKDVMTKGLDEGRSSDEAEGDEFDELEQEVEKIAKDLVRLRRLEKMNIGEAKAVDGSTSAAGAASRSNRAETASHISVKSNAPKGAAFTRMAIAKMVTKGDVMAAAEYAKSRWPDAPEVQTMIKAAVAAGTTTDATFAGPLAQTRVLTEEFIELLRPATLIGKIPNLRRIPFNVSVTAQTGGGAYNWVGQGKPKPLTSAAFGTVTLGIAKAAGIIVLTEELVKISQPSAEEAIRKEMVAGISQFLDGQFINPAVTAVANVNPASITNGTTAVTSAGTSADNARTDIKALISSFVASNLSTANAVLIMSEANAFALGTALNPLGQPLYGDLGAKGGDILGIPVVTSQSAGSTIALVDAQGVLFADDGDVSVDVSREASLDMDSSPADPTVAATVMVSLWQRNLVGLRAERFINWQRAYPAAVKYTTQTYV